MVVNDLVIKNRAWARSTLAVKRLPRDSQKARTFQLFHYSKTEKVVHVQSHQHNSGTQQRQDFFSSLQLVKVFEQENALSLFIKGSFKFPTGPSAAGATEYS
jgi:hypothetical protein